MRLPCHEFQLCVLRLQILQPIAKGGSGFLLLLCLDRFDKNGNDIGIGDALVTVAIRVNEFGQKLLHFLSDETELLARIEIHGREGVAVVLITHAAQVENGFEGVEQSDNSVLETDILRS